MQDGLERALEYSDYVALPDDGKRYEILAGTLLVTPAPRPLHQRVVVRLYSALQRFFGGRSEGEVLVAPIDLILGKRDVLQPDLLVVDDRATITERGIEGAPLLVVEVLSKTTADRDRGAKSRRYAELGIRHYWLVDPDARRVECRRLEGGAYRTTVAAEGDASLAPPEFDGLRLSLTALWAESEVPRRD